MIHFVVHEDGDSVGTVVVEGVKANDTLTGWVMEQDQTIKIKTLEDIPIGHKIAVKALKQDETVIKYGVDIGRAIAPIKKGGYAIHNNAHDVLQMVVLGGFSWSPISTAGQCVPPLPMFLSVPSW